MTAVIVTVVTVDIFVESLSDAHQVFIAPLLSPYIGPCLMPRCDNRLWFFQLSSPVGSRS
jgi:hypothetical protein